MIKDTIYSIKSSFRGEMNILGYRFGKGEKSACIVGPTRGNEVQQLYICSQIIKALSRLEKTGAIVNNNEIMVIPSINHYSINIERRFWGMDNTDINRMFPGENDGETTKRIAAGVFDAVKGYSYGIQFASFHTPGDFIPHVRMMETGYHNTSLANLFGLPFVMTRKPQPIDTGTLNYNWQLNGTNAFSVYTSATDRIDEKSAKQAVSSVLRFLTRMGIIKYNCHNGFIATTLEEELLMSIRADVSGIYRRFKEPGDEVTFGDLLAEVVDPIEGEVISQIIAPSDGIIFFAHGKPLVVENCTVYKLIRRLHE
ncbi:M14 family metallopeptidase [Anaerocolumna sp. AGMB13025]|uniref:M14 family metallopeptidase n=1 Tax=Anaerocolumna sp. AGMB13025 TaxID=3039116 RepID=UPI00241FCF27|nr:M14 family metallopeptidase [Anaerocolumna sp. AGMB13025]WFR59409.1 M14 family metallopeptidase [Anaerocolumna sp. AGMB13025]